MIFPILLLSAMVLMAEANPVPIQKQKLRFKISGNGLPDKDNLGTSDPYVELFYTEDGSTKENKFGRTDTITDTENPNWGNIFEFEFDRLKGQKWHFKVYDHDNGREDDTVGKAWVNVDDYVDRGQVYTANLHKKGTITITTVDPVPIPQQTQPLAPLVQPQPVQQTIPLAPIQQTVPLAPIAVQPVVNQPRRLKFKLSARGLPDTDIIGTIDAYVKAYYTDATNKADTQFGRTAPVSDSENPNFKEVFEFDYIQGKQQRWHFVVLDDDENRRDDEGGEAYLDVDEYVQKGEQAILSLPKGQLILTRV